MKTNQIDLIMLYTSIVSGIQKHIKSDITLDGVAYTPAALEKLFAEAAAAIEAARTQLDRYHDVVNAEHAAEEQGSAVAQSLRNALIAQYGKQANEVLGDFGMTVPKPKGAKTVEAKAEGIARRALTRQARHTMGADQKKAVTGMVEVPYNQPTATPAATPATPAAVAAVPAAREAKEAKTA